MDMMGLHEASVGLHRDHKEMCDAQAPPWLRWCDAMGSTRRAPWLYRDKSHRGLALCVACSCGLYVLAPWLCK